MEYAMQKQRQHAATHPFAALNVRLVYHLVLQILTHVLSGT